MSEPHKEQQQPKGDISDLELVEGRLEGLKLLLNTPVDEKTMTDAELKHAIGEVQIILDCMKITASSRPRPAPAFPHQLLEKYIQNLNTHYVDFADGTIIIYRNKNNKNDQIKIPIHPEYPDYEELIIRAIAAIRAEAARKAREDTIYELLKLFGYSCPGGELTPICGMCKANKYCIEIRKPNTTGRRNEFG